MWRAGSGGFEGNDALGELHIVVGSGVGQLSLHGLVAEVGITHSKRGGLGGFHFKPIVPRLVGLSESQHLRAALRIDAHHHARQGLPGFVAHHAANHRLPMGGEGGDKEEE